MKLLSACAVTVAALLVAVPVNASRSVVVQFRTPSGNIGCAYNSALSGSIRAGLRCDIRSGLKPTPPHPQNCDLEFGDSVGINRTGHAYYVCHGDTTLDPRARVLSYGTTWRKNGFTCTSQTTGLRCKNLSGHGFFLSRGHSFRF